MFTPSPFPIRTLRSHSWSKASLGWEPRAIPTLTTKSRAAGRGPPNGDGPAGHPYLVGNKSLPIHRAVGKSWGVPYALMQSRLETPDREALRRAFRCGAGLTPMDAPHVARDAFGILLKNLEHEDAIELHHALAQEGIETELVDHADLPQLSDWKQVRRVAVRATGLVVCDPYGRELEIPWENFSLISAGLVWDTEFVRSSSPSGGSDHSDDFADLLALRTAHALGMGNWGASSSLASFAPTPITSSQERQVWRWSADLFLKGVPLRFILRPEQLQFIDQDQRADPDPTLAFLELIRSLSHHTPSALTNRVVYALREGHTDTLSYPSRNAYQEEMIWILWRLRQAGGGS